MQRVTVLDTNSVTADLTPYQCTSEFSVTRSVTV